MDLAGEGDRLLEIARASCVAGGFAWLDDDGVPDRSEPLRLWITARMTHVFALGHLLGRPGCAELVDHGLVGLSDTFQDREAGDWFAAVRDGRPVGTEKSAYEYAFVLLAASSAETAGRPGAETLREEAADVFLGRFWSEQDGLSRECWDRHWRTLDRYRGANANMHAAEAFLAVGDATGDPAWHRRALRIVERLVRGVARAHGWRLPEHFDAQWRPVPAYNEDRPRDPFRPYGVTPGHALEWSRDRTWHGKPDVYHAIQATLVPRLPLAPTFARALRDDALASA